VAGVFKQPAMWNWQSNEIRRLSHEDFGFSYGEIGSEICKFWSYRDNIEQYQKQRRGLANFIWPKHAASTPEMSSIASSSSKPFFTSFAACSTKSPHIMLWPRYHLPMSQKHEIATCGYLPLHII
jgi:hypothetical protein